jgi:hypothetical protein
MLRLLSIICLLLAVAGCSDKQAGKAYKFSELAHGYYELLPSEQAKCTTVEISKTSQTCININQVMAAMSHSGMGYCLKPNKSIDHACIDGIVKKLNKE